MFNCSALLRKTAYTRRQARCFNILIGRTMSKLFFKGRIDTRQNHVMSGYNVNREVKAGSAESPLSLSVQTEARHAEVLEILNQNKLVAEIKIDAAQDENIIELETILNKPKTTTFEKTPNRNDPCSCGSGKKYKKCCG